MLAVFKTLSTRTIPSLGLLLGAGKTLSMLLSPANTEQVISGCRLLFSNFSTRWPPSAIAFLIPLEELIKPVPP